MKRILVAVAGVLALVVVSLFFVTRTPFAPVNAPKIVVAAKAYAADLRAKGAEVPPSVSLDELIHKGMLNREDIGGFSGLKAMVSLTGTAEGSPQGVLMTVQLEGERLVALNDGSVITLKSASDRNLKNVVAYPK